MVRKKVAVITLHGMGRTKENYHAELQSELEKRLGKLWSEVHFGSVYYQDILQKNEDEVWKRVRERLGAWNPWRGLRKFILFGFADAAGLEAHKGRLGSVYREAQIRIARKLWEAGEALDLGAEGPPVCVIAHSLGGQVLSNYLWDAQEHLERAGAVEFGMGAALLRRRLFHLFMGVFARGRSLFGSFCAGTAPRTAPTGLFRAASPA